MLVEPRHQMRGRVGKVFAHLDVKGVDEVDDELEVVWGR
jgi:hypothetical protein